MAIGRDFRVGLFDRLSGPGGTGFDYTEDDKNRISRQGLLGLAAGLLGTGGGFGNALSNGLRTGLLSFNQGADDLVNDRYRQAMMQRTMAGMDRNNRMEQMRSEVLNPDGSINREKLNQAALLDPDWAKNFQDFTRGPQEKWEPTEITDPNNPGNVISVLHNSRGEFLYPDRSPVFGGGAQQAAPQITGGLLGGVSPGLGASDIGILKPEQVQSQYTQLASSFPGTQISSRLRTPEHNRAVGGVANSQHIRGTAADFVVPAQARPDFIQRAKGMGFQAIDEGDHVHLELPGRGGARPQVAQGNRFSRPRYAPTSGQGRDNFRRLTATEVKEAGLPPGTVAQLNEMTNQVSIISKPDAREGSGGVMPLSAGEAAKVRRDFKETKDALNTFKAFGEALKAIPSGPGLLLDGKSQGRLGTSYNNARAALRILYNTGVLQPGELPMLESALKDPTSFKAIADPRTRPQIHAQLDELYRTITRGIENQVTSYPQIFNQQKFEDTRSARQAAAQANQGVAPTKTKADDGWSMERVD